MGLHIILGGADRKSATAFVYAGHSGAESRAAMEASQHAVFCILDNPTHRFKNNQRAAAVIPAAIEAAAEPETPSTRGRRRN